MFLLICDPVFAPMISSWPIISMMLLSVTVRASGPLCLAFAARIAKMATIARRERWCPPSAPRREPLQCLTGKDRRDRQIACVLLQGRRRRIASPARSALSSCRASFLLGEDRTSDVIGDGERGIISGDQQHAIKKVL